MNLKKSNILKTLGPGLLWAGAAVGVSHLVQSTRAGAYYGFYFIGFLLLANFLKYPFFEFAPRYAAATGNNLIQAYKKIGNWAIWLYIVLTVLTMFTIQAAVTVVTAGLIGNIFHIPLNITEISVILLVVIMLILLIGKFSVLDKLMKFIIILLSLTAIFAVINGFFAGYHPQEAFLKSFHWSNAVDLAFLIAFIGWMPAPIDVSIWHSFWTVEKKRETGYQPKLKEALLDFNIGYFGTVVLALAFLSLGALFMYGTGNQFSGKGVAFSGQLIEMFTKSIGSWAYPVIAIAALTTMFSTTLTCMDAYSRVLPEASALVQNKTDSNSKKNIIFWMLILVSGTLIILFFLMKNMKSMVDLATTISFVTAPLLAILNYKAVMSKEVPDAYKPKKWLKIYAWLGIAFLTAFSVFYLIWRFIL